MNIIQKAYAQEGLMAQPIFRYFENIEYYHNLTLIFLIMLFLISISFLITEYFIIYQPRFNFWHIFKKNRIEKRIKIEVLDTEGNPIKFALLTVMDKGGAVIERLYCNAQGKQKLGYSPKGTVTV